MTNKPVKSLFWQEQASTNQDVIAARKDALACCILNLKRAKKNKILNLFQCIKLIMNFIQAWLKGRKKL